VTRPYLQHGRRHAPTGSDPIDGLGNDWCMAKATGSVPGDNSDTQFDLELAFGSGVDSGIFTQDTGGSFDTVQINNIGTFRIQWTAAWTGSISSPSDGQILLAKADTATGLQTHNFGFGGTGEAGAEILRASGTDYSGKVSSGGFLHWPTNTDTPPTFGTSLIGMTSNQNTGSSLTLVLWVYIERVDLWMLDNTTASIFSP
jgi:hypothetical protein